MAEAQRPQGITPPASLFAGIKEARLFSKGNYVRPGQYWLRIDKLKIDRNRKREEFAAHEMTVVKVFDNDAGRGHRVGEEVSHLLMVKSDYFVRDVKGFIAAIMGLDPDSIDESAAVTIYDPVGQPLRGITIEIAASHITTKVGGVFTRVDYRREVPASEVLGALSPEERARFYPGQVLERLAALETPAK